MDHAHRPDPLRKPAIAFGCLIAVTVLFAAFGPKAELPRAWERSAAAQSVALSFLDAENGTVIVVDAGSGAEVARLGIGEGGFVRSTMRNLARERLRRDLSRETPFVVQRLESGAIILNDPETGRIISLDAFGDANAAAFAAFLDHGREPQ
jgi:putative photosynthetic complex assembly protein